MIAYILNRLLQAVGVMIMVALIAFIMFNYVGDPVSNMVGQEMSIADREALRDRLGLNDPMHEQFVRFIGNAIRGQFGISYKLQRPVDAVIAERLPATLELVAISAVFALAVGIALGIYTGLNRNTTGARLVLTLSLIGVSLPTFVIGIVLIFIFSVQLGWLPSFGRGETIHLGVWTTGLLTASGWQAVIMPAITLGLYQLTLILRIVRAEMLEVLRTDYIKFARARGLRNRTIHFGHALKNTL
ncbi:MAG: ABC transporter permease, partial [Candidatus Tectomicrobia bacterium]|nr:ABC transporter permease [Candidatus Tectomicrobia bacterium]